ncbi:uncharacterized protein LOC101846698 [Aplysia californica]|uniref:Uncharacterized protein LOC101846698 n=1 Tax=Aplysia californica TaxID=6500 RepID=A0ABM0JA34_APLCA|nr:uncharacterized protein LOC101846698 [Aplysia californica]
MAAVVLSLVLTAALFIWPLSLPSAHENYLDNSCYSGVSCSDTCLNYSHGEKCNSKHTLCPCGVRECRRYNGTCLYTCVDHTVTVVSGSNNTCNATCIGACFSGSECEGNVCEECIPGYYGMNCSLKCDSLCAQDCEKHSGYCDECIQGVYGRECRTRCPEHCLSKNCTRENGECEKCQPGFIGGKCSIRCSEGYFGDQCQSTCAQSCKHSKCNHVTGRCLQGCIPGYFGKFCDLACPNGTYGAECLSQCPATCLPGTPCHHENGECIQGCTAGYSGEVCDTVCSEGHYGESCLQNCSDFCFLRLCNPFSGRCTACVRGRSGPLCDTIAEQQTYPYQSLIHPEMTPNMVLGVVFSLLGLGMTLWCITGASAYFRNMLSLEKVYKTGKLPRRWRKTPHIRGKFVVTSQHRRVRPVRRSTRLSENWIWKLAKQENFTDKLKLNFPKRSFRPKKSRRRVVEISNEESTTDDRARLSEFPSKLDFSPDVGVQNVFNRPCDLTLESELAKMEKGSIIGDSEINTTSDSENDSVENTEDIGFGTISEATFVPSKQDESKTLQSDRTRISYTSSGTGKAQSTNVYSTEYSSDRTSRFSTRLKLRRPTSRVHSQRTSQRSRRTASSVSSLAETEDESTEPSEDIEETTSTNYSDTGSSTTRLTNQNEAPSWQLDTESGSFQQRQETQVEIGTQQRDWTEKKNDPVKVAITKTVRIHTPESRTLPARKNRTGYNNVVSHTRTRLDADTTTDPSPVPFPVTDEVGYGETSRPTIIERGLKNMASIFDRFRRGFTTRQSAGTSEAPLHPTVTPQLPSTNRTTSNQFLLTRIDEWWKTHRPGQVHRGPPIGVAGFISEETTVSMNE